MLKEGAILLHFLLVELKLDLQGSGLALEPNKVIFLGLNDSSSITVLTQ